ncbi:hypothetical protein [Tsukamurella ocularis]
MTQYPWDAPSPTTPFPRPWSKTETPLTSVPVHTGPPPGWPATAPKPDPATRFPWVTDGATQSRPAVRTPDDVIRTYATWRYRASAFKAASIRAAMGVKVA